MSGTRQSTLGSTAALRNIRCSSAAPSFSAASSEKSNPPAFADCCEEFVHSRSGRVLADGDCLPKVSYSALIRRPMNRRMRRMGKAPRDKPPEKYSEDGPWRRFDRFVMNESG